MILATPSGNREARAFEGSDFIPPPGSEAATSALAQRREIAVPAVAAAVRLLSETIGSFVLRVYEGDALSRQPITDHPLARLFQEPAEGWSSFDVWSDVVTALELERNAFLWKVVVNRRVEEIIPVDPGYFRVTREKVGKPARVEARIGGAIEDVTDRVIRIRSWSPNASVEGVSTIDLHRRSLRGASAYDEYRGRYFDNDATPSLVLKHPGNPNRDQRRDLLAAWVRRHGGPRNVGRPGIIWGGVEVETLSPTMRDSQTAEVADAIVRDVARAFRIFPASLLHAAVASVAAGITSAELTSDLFHRFSLLSRMRRIERALHADRDLFRERAVFPRFDVGEFTRGDVTTTANKIHKLVQVGAYTQNEGRAELGLAPVPDADELLWPPVGADTPRTEPPDPEE